MSRAANCYDNAFMESCFSTLKTELEMTEYDHGTHARTEIAEYIPYYNAERRHSSLDYLSLVAFEAQQSHPVSSSTVRKLRCPSFYGGFLSSAPNSCTNARRNGSTSVTRPTV